MPKGHADNKRGVSPGEGATHSADNGKGTQGQVAEHQVSPGAMRIPLWNSFLTMSGLFITATGIMLLLTYGLFSLVTAGPNPYGAIVAYMVARCVSLRWRVTATHLCAMPRT